MLNRRIRCIYFCGSSSTEQVFHKGRCSSCIEVGVTTVNLICLNSKAIAVQGNGYNFLGACNEVYLHVGAPNKDYSITADTNKRATSKN